MKIQTNLNSMNALRNLGVTESQQSSEIAKLSSGYRLNRAGDDAAGMSIANSLRSAGKALGQAQKNAQQAGSFLQIADGAVQTLSTMLDRMRELATEAASDNVTDADRSKISSEFTSLQSEWDRIVNTTQYQGQTLLNGSFGVSDSGTLKANSSVSNVSLTGASASKTYTITQSAATAVTLSDGATSQTITTSAGTAGGTQHMSFDKLGISFDFKGVLGATTLDSLTVVTGASQAASFRVGSGTSTNDTVSVALDDLRASTLTIDASTINVTSSANAATALTNITAALGSLNTAIGNIGAAENRMDYATANLNSLMQNTSAAESTIRDADMAQEYTQYTKLSILQQAGTAMLAQANSSSQSILQLLRG
jgi:flagellin